MAKVIRRGYKGWDSEKRPECRLSFSGAFCLGHNTDGIDRSDAFWDECSAHEMRRAVWPFAAFDDPLVAALVAQNQSWYEALRLAATSPVSVASSTEHYAHDLDGEFGLLSDHNPFTGLSLRLRVMLNIGENRIEDAWADIDLMRLLAARGLHAPYSDVPLHTFSILEQTACECAATGFLTVPQNVDALTDWLAALPTPVSYTHLTLPTICSV